MRTTSGGALVDARQEGWKQPGQSGKSIQDGVMSTVPKKHTASDGDSMDRLAVAEALDIGRKALAEMVEMARESRDDDSFSIESDKDSMILSPNRFASHQRRTTMEKRLRELSAPRGEGQPESDSKDFDQDITANPSQESSKFDVHVSLEWEDSADQSPSTSELGEVQASDQKSSSDIKQSDAGLSAPTEKKRLLKMFKTKVRTVADAPDDQRNELTQGDNARTDNPVTLPTEEKRVKKTLKTRSNGAAAAFKKKIAQKKKKEQKKAKSKGEGEASKTKNPPKKDTKDHTEKAIAGVSAAPTKKIVTSPTSKVGGDVAKAKVSLKKGIQEQTEAATANAGQAPAVKKNSSLKKNDPSKKTSRKKIPSKRAKGEHKPDDVSEGVAGARWWKKKENLSSPDTDDSMAKTQKDHSATPKAVQDQPTQREVIGNDKSQGQAEKGGWALKIKLLPKHRRGKGTRRSTSNDEADAFDQDESVLIDTSAKQQGETGEALSTDGGSKEDQSDARERAGGLELKINILPKRKRKSAMTFLRDQEPKTLEVIPEEVKKVSWIRKLINALEKEETMIEDEPSNHEDGSRTSWKRRVSLVLADEDKRIEEDALNGTSDRNKEGRTSWMRRMATALEAEEKRIDENTAGNLQNVDTKDRSEMVKDMVKALEEMEEDFDGEVQRTVWVRNMMVALEQEEKKVDVKFRSAGQRLKKTWVRKMITALEEGERRIALDAAETTPNEEQNTRSRLVLGIMVAMQDEDKRVGPQAAKEHWEWVKSVVDALEEEKTIGCSTDSTEKHERKVGQEGLQQLVTVMSNEASLAESRKSEPIAQSPTPDQSNACLDIPISICMPAVVNKSRQHILTSTPAEKLKAREMSWQKPLNDDGGTTISFHSSFVAPTTFRSERHLITSPSLTRDDLKTEENVLSLMPKPSDISGMTLPTQDGIQCQWASNISESCAQFGHGVCVSANKLQFSFNQMCLAMQGKSDRIYDDDEEQQGDEPQVRDVKDSIIDGSMQISTDDRNGVCLNLIEEKTENLATQSIPKSVDVEEEEKVQEEVPPVIEEEGGGPEEVAPAEEEGPAQDEIVNTAPCDDEANILGNDEVNCSAESNTCEPLDKNQDEDPSGADDLSDMAESTEKPKESLSRRNRIGRNGLSKKLAKRVTSVQLGAIRATQHLSQQAADYFAPESAPRRHQPRSRKGPQTPKYSKAL